MSRARIFSLFLALFAAAVAAQTTHSTEKRDRSAQVKSHLEDIKKKAANLKDKADAATQRKAEAHDRAEAAREKAKQVQALSLIFMGVSDRTVPEASLEQKPAIKNYRMVQHKDGKSHTSDWGAEYGPPSQPKLHKSASARSAFAGALASLFALATLGA